MIRIDRRTRVRLTAGLAVTSVLALAACSPARRLRLARALIADTGLILCGEPLSNLDADLRERMRVEISALVREAA